MYVWGEEGRLSCQHVQVNTTTATTTVIIIIQKIRSIPMVIASPVGFAVRCCCVVRVILVVVEVGVLWRRTVVVGISDIVIVVVLYRVLYGSLCLQAQCQ